jgi:hypothetical protein
MGIRSIKIDDFMKILIYMLIPTMFSMSAFSQRIDNKVNIYIGYQTGSFQGPNTVTEGSFMSPSLFANFNKVNGMSVEVSNRVNKFFSITLGASNLNASDWRNGMNNDYTGATISLFSLSPGVQFHSAFKPLGLLNKVKPFLEIAPTVGFSSLKLAHSMFDIQGQNGSVAQPLTSINAFGGIKAQAGAALILSNYFGVHMSYSYQYNRISSKLFNDKFFAVSQVNLGFYLRLKNDKMIYN